MVVPQTKRLTIIARVYYCLRAATRHQQVFLHQARLAVHKVVDRLVDNARHTARSSRQLLLPLALSQLAHCPPIPKQVPSTVGRKRSPPRRKKGRLLREIFSKIPLSRTGIVVLPPSGLFPVVCSTIARGVFELISQGRHLSTERQRGTRQTWGFTSSILCSTSRREPKNPKTRDSLSAASPSGESAGSNPLSSHRSTSYRGLSPSHRLLAVCRVQGVVGIWGF